MKPIGILGGTFDPIHNGHLAIASHVFNTLSCEYIDFIPCFQPPHRENPIASPAHRLAMTQLATENNPSFRVNSIEIERENVSYSVDTLKKLRTQMPYQSFCFILGSDAFSHLHQWHDWQQFCELTHLIVVTRKNIVLPQSDWIDDLLAKRKTEDKHMLQQQPAGKIYFLPMNPVEISATRIRQAILAHQQNITEVPTAVLEYIHAYNVYQTM